MKQSITIITLLAVLGISQLQAKTPVGSIGRDTIMGVPCRVYLPHAYYDRVQNGKTVFPVLYLHHGMYGSEDDWTEQGHLLRWMEMLLMADQVREMVVVMPDNFLGSIPPAERQQLIDAPNINPNGEAFDTENGSAHWRKLTSDQEMAYEMSGYWEEHFRAFMQEVEQRYSVSTNPAQRAIAGLSMGGFHTMHVAHYLHGEFAYVGLFSAVIIPRDGHNDVSTEEDTQYQTAGFDYQLDYRSPAYNNWMSEMRDMTAAPPMYWIGMGRDDFLFAQMQDFRLWLDTYNFEYTYYESRGGHTWDNWQNYLCRFLKRIMWDNKL